MTLIQRTLASWWKRIIIFLGLSVFLLILLIIIIGFFSINQNNNYNEYNIDFINSFDIYFFIIPLFCSILIEGLRAGHKFTSFGIKVTKRTIYDSLSSAVFVLFPFIILLVSLKLFRIEITLNRLLLNQIFYLIIMFLSLACTEELIFRGIIFQALIVRFGILPALIVSSLGFSSAHLLNPYFNVIGFINTFIAGILLGVMFIKTKSLYLPVFWHFSWNFSMQVIVGSNVSGYNFGNSLFNINWNSMPTWLFGGNYGLEGGLICTLILICTIPLVLKFTKPSPYVSAMLYRQDLMESQII